MSGRTGIFDVALPCHIYTALEGFRFLTHQKEGGILHLHPGNAQEAVEIQRQLRKKVRLQDDFRTLRYIAGIDVGYDPRRALSRAAVVLVDIESLELLHSVVACDATPFPYIPGLLSFREAPVALKALACLEYAPDLLMIDGHGVAHPRRLGIAAHIGVLTGLPAIGVAKKKLCGRYEEPEMHKGAFTDLADRGEKIGTVLRSRDKTAPLFISPGHRISHERALRIVLQCLRGFRLPEPTRLADKLSKFS